MSTFDDSDDKVRRNVVSVCSLLIINAWLGIDLANLINKYIADTPISPIKLKILALIFITYLWSRYWFSDKTQEDYKILKENFADLFKKTISSKLTKELQKHAKSHNTKHAPSFLRAGEDSDLPKKTNDSFNINITGVQIYEKEMRKLKSAVSLILYEEKSLHKSNHHERTKYYNLNKYSLPKLYLITSLLLLTRTRVATSFVVPSLLAFTSFATVSFQLSLPIFNKILHFNLF